VTVSGGLVAIEKCDVYEPVAIAAALDATLAHLGGMSAFVKPGQSVLLKVNLLTKAEPDRAVTTHPELVRAVVRLAKAAGAGSIAIGDSPGGRTSANGARAIFEASGMAEVARDEDVDLVLLDDDVVRMPVPDGVLYQHFNLGRAVVESDVLIDLPRLKTHGFMMMTGAVKNLFGCIPGLEKAQFHVKVPDRDDFGEMLVDLLLACQPDLCIMDAIIGMEGAGPSGGSPRRIGAVLASADAVAMDVVAAAITGFDPMDVYTNAAANRRALGPKTADEVETVGTPWRDLVVADFQHPSRDLARNMPPAIGKWVRARIVSRPWLEQPEICNGCRTCERDCPVDAITMVDGKPTYDYSKCIRCYCCQELCPTHAVGLKQPWLVRTFVVRGGSERA
jgi:uncharacterized protein (DUF362 family)/Pyruvate/2-oxoacid:ferredoxin oxidoreductase delta subunit